MSIDEIQDGVAIAVYRAFPFTGEVNEVEDELVSHVAVQLFFLNLTLILCQ